MSHFRKSLCKVFYIFSHNDDRLPVGTESRQTKTQKSALQLKENKIFFATCIVFNYFA